MERQAAWKCMFAETCRAKLFSQFFALNKLNSSDYYIFIRSTSLNRLRLINNNIL